ncbi:MAG: helix-turn-helix domain-containing protein [bacterium]|nr:helix-turn-helix domain-containing protein [bacterium]
MGKEENLLDLQQEQLEKIGNGLRSLRIEKGHTNYEYLAYEMGMSRSQYGAYEKGKNMTLGTLMRILNHFDMTVFDFFEYLRKIQLTNETK